MPKKNYKIVPKRKPRRKMRIPRSLDQNQLSVKLHADPTSYAQIENSALSDTQAAMNFALSLMLDYSKYTAIFDQFRIDKIQVKFIQRQTQVVNRPFDDSTSGSLIHNIPNFVTAIDYDDVASGTYDQIISRHGSKMTLATQNQTLTFRPARLVEIYRAVTSAYMTDKSKNFLDCAYADTPHYGVKAVLQVASPARAYVYIPEVTGWFTFKNRRH